MGNARRALPSRAPANQHQLSGSGSLTERGGIDPGNLHCRPRLSELLIYTKTPDATMGPYTPLARRDFDVSPRGTPRVALSP